MDTPTKPFRNDLTAWKLLFGDLHQNLMDAGFEQTETEGQLDIDALEDLPGENKWAGFIEYDVVR